jgi:hemerythrin-like metal-binding protein
MYYSYFSTGNVRIDSEHANIDCMIDLCHSKKGEWIPAARVLITALANHFDSEEMIAREEGLNMTSEHLQEHEALKARLTALEKQIEDGEVDKAIFLSTLRDTLFFHISNFDKYLNAE